MAANTPPVIRVLTAEDAPAFWQLRSEALEREPEAFGESAEEHRANSTVETVATRLAATSPENFVLGAFLNGQLVGTVGFFRIQTVKRKHKGRVWGTYVADSTRGQSVGRALMAALVERARAIPDLEEVLLSVSASQSAARNLYVSLGFEPYGLERRSLRVGERFLDEEYMALRLRDHPAKRPD